MEDYLRDVINVECVPFAEGGFSHIYKAVLYRPGHNSEFKVAIKVEIRTPDEERLEYEAKIWAKAGRHPNITPFLGKYRIRGALGLVSPYYEHGHIIQFLDKYPWIPPIPLLGQIAAGLAWLHSAAVGLAHGDIKPRNILINGECQASITDFGLAQPLAAGDTGNTYITYRYIAPEWVYQSYFTTATDVWAFGFAALEILTGRKPFPTLPGYAVICRVSKHRRPLRSNYSSIPESVWNFLQSTWCADPSARPSAQHIQRFFASLPEHERRFVTSRSPVAYPSLYDVQAHDCAPNPQPLASGRRACSAVMSP